MEEVQMNYAKWKKSDTKGYCMIHSHLSLSIKTAIHTYKYIINTYIKYKLCISAYIFTYKHLHIYIYISVCVCVHACMNIWKRQNYKYREQISRWSVSGIGSVWGFDHKGAIWGNVLWLRELVCVLTVVFVRTLYAFTKTNRLLQQKEWIYCVQIKT